MRSVILAQPEWLMLLGGSLMQVAVPLICAVALSSKDRNGALLTLYWAAQSLGNVSVYMRDAPTRSLPLITGDPDTHDWWQLLAGHLEFAAPLADATLCVAWALLIAAAVALHLPGAFHELLALISGGDQREHKDQES